MSRRAGLLSVVFLGSIALSAQIPTKPAEPSALVNACVVDPARVDGLARCGDSVHLSGGRIVSVAQSAPAKSTTTIDLRGRYVVPGLIDAHVHIANLRAARSALESGVTTVRSAGVSSYTDVGIRELVKKGMVAGPEVLASGYHVRPMIAEEAFFDHPGLSDLMRGVTTPDALRRVVEGNLSRGVDWIKVLATERAGTPDTDPRKQVFSEAELRVIVETAAAKGVSVQAHAHGAEGALAAIKAGVRSIEHGTYLTDEALQLMAKQGTFFDPTMEAVKDLAEPGGDYDHRDLQLRGRHMLPVLCGAVARAHKLDVPIAVGTDTSYGPTSVARLAIEIKNLVDCGLSSSAALQAATSGNAKLLQRETQLGQILPGFEADLVVVERNPLHDISTLQDPLLVISNGRVVLDRLNFGR